MRKKQRKFHPDLWGKAPVQEVLTLPCGIDGLAVYITWPLGMTNRLSFCQTEGSGKKVP